MSVGGTGKEGDGEPTRTSALFPSFLSSGAKRQGRREGMSQEKRDKTEEADYEYNISSLGKRLTAGMNGNNAIRSECLERTFGRIPSLTLTF
jgi:hypothetical protein